MLLIKLCNKLFTISHANSILVKATCYMKKSNCAGGRISRNNILKVTLEALDIEKMQSNYLQQHPVFQSNLPEFSCLFSLLQ